MSRPSLPLNLPLTVTVLAWGFNFVGLKILYKEVSPEAVSLIRFLVMWAILGAICLAAKESLKFPKEDRWRLLFFGFMSMGVYMVLFLEGLRLSSPAVTAIILNTSPIITMLLMAAMGHERLRAGAFLGAIIAFSGVVMVILAGTVSGEGSLMGNLIILLSAVAWAYCVVLMKPLLDRYSPLRVLTLSMPGALPVLLTYGLLATLQVDYGAISPMGWSMLFHISVISGVVAFLCFYKGVRMAGGNGAMLSMFFVPPTAAFFAYLMLDYVLLPLQFLGLAVVIAGVSLSQWSRLKHAAMPEPEPVVEGTI